MNSDNAILDPDPAARLRATKSNPILKAADGPPFPGHDLDTAAPKPSHESRTLQLILSIRLIPSVCALLLTGCFLPAPPLRLPTSIKTPSGTKTTLAPEAPVPGKATRQQVEDAYNAFKVEWGEADLFWGRFYESKWSSVILTGTEQDRIWNTRDILANFDENGYVKTFEIIHEDTLVKHLISLEKESRLPPLNTGMPIVLDDIRWARQATPMGMELTDSGVILRFNSPEWAHTRPKWPQTVSVAKERIIRFEALDIGDLYTTSSRLKFKFSGQTAVGKSFEFFAGPKDVLTLARWFAQVENETQSTRNLPPQR